jgi:Ca2+-binding EF-hand superfamily protein
MLITGKSRYGRAAPASLLLLAAGVAATTLAVPARAATDPRLAALFDWLDADNDHRVSAVEFTGSPAAQANARPAPTGALTLTVETRVPPPRNESREALFARLDIDGDRGVSLEEFAEGCVAHTIANPEIAIADANRDGALTEGELVAYLVALRVAAGEAEAPEGPTLLARGTVLEYDSDGDGKIPVADLLTR